MEKDRRDGMMDGMMDGMIVTLDDDKDTNISFAVSYVYQSRITLTFNNDIDIYTVFK